ncbi:MAG: FAD-dependent oxidoreductase [bacterium]
MRLKNGIRLITFGSTLLCAGAFGRVEAPANTLLVEAESFDQLGGWVNDQQFMDQMGSPFLLAHGLGKPVQDATTKVKLPGTGTYRVWVRTRDWVATWKAPGAPGKFQVLVNNTPLETVFGTQREDWHWQDGGTVEVTRADMELALHDLTGFEGRCDAILFSADPTFMPPKDPSGEFRRKLLGIAEVPEAAGAYDLVVVGGGVAGMTAAVSAGRLGLRVALIHNRPMLGGNNSPEAKVSVEGDGCKEPYPKVGIVTRELGWSYSEMKKGQPFAGVPLAKLFEIKTKTQLDALKQANVALFLNSHVNGIVTNSSGRITEVIAQNITNARRSSFKGTWFVDCTGDGTVGFLAGADFDMDQVLMGRSNLWGIRNTGKLSPFPKSPWAFDLTDQPFPGRGGKWTCLNGRFAGLGGWYWEAGFERDPFAEGERIRDTNFRAMYGVWDCLKNVDNERANYELADAKYISGLRESRRLMGDVVLSVQDLKSGKAYPDGCVPTSWDLDVHIPNPLFTDRSGRKDGFVEDPFVSDAPMGKNTSYKKPYWIPYRCFYSRNIPNLFMAGRDISVTHNALGAVRVQWTTGMMGEIVGMAASLCKKHDTNPRGVYQNHLEELQTLMKRGVASRSN